jgi:SsrA-binding protein
MKKAVNIENRKARYEYHFLEEYEVGVCLVGSEVKSIKDARVTMVDAFCYFDSGELFVKDLTITPIDKNYTHEPKRLRKLLLHRKQLTSLEKGLTVGKTIVLTRIKESNGKIKFCIALAQGKKDYDKRQTIKKREADREIKNESHA